MLCVPLPKVSLMNFLFLVLWAFALPFPRVRPIASSVSSVWACVMVVCKMLYQLKVIKPLEYSSNCTTVSLLTARMQNTDQILKMNYSVASISTWQWLAPKGIMSCLRACVCV